MHARWTSRAALPLGRQLARPRDVDEEFIDGDAVNLTSSVRALRWSMSSVQCPVCAVLVWVVCECASGVCTGEGRCAIYPSHRLASSSLVRLSILPPSLSVCLSVCVLHSFIHSAKETTNTSFLPPPLPGHHNEHRDPPSLPLEQK